MSKRIALLVLLVGLNARDKVPAQAVIEHPSECSVLDSTEIALAEILSVRLDAGQTAIEVALTRDELGALLEDRKTVLRFDSHGKRLGTLQLDDSVTAFAGGLRTSYLIATPSSVFRWTSGKHEQERTTLLPAAALPGTAHSIAETGEYLWIGASEAGAFQLLAFSKEDLSKHRYAPLFSIDLPGPSRVRAYQSAEAVLIGLSAFPFSILKVTPDRRVRIIVSESAAQVRSAHPLDGVRYHALAPLPLDCGAVLQMVIDLRSALRRVRLIDSSTARIVREQEILIPFGLTTLSPEQPWLAGARERRGGVDVLVLRWSWRAAK